MNRSIQSCNHLFDLSPRAWHPFEHVLQFDLWRRQNLNNYTNRWTIAIFLKSLLHEIELIFLLNQNFLAGSEKRTSCSSSPVLAQVTTTQRSDLGTESFPKTGWLKIFCQKKQQYKNSKSPDCWNFVHLKVGLHRHEGAYYDTGWRAAVKAQPSIVSITSFNEWGEGTQVFQKHFHISLWRSSGTTPLPSSR